MRHAHRIRPDDLMNPDVMSEAVLIGSLLGVFGIVTLFFLRFLH